METDLGTKPIETVYVGYRFRSRLEARWAIFFDTLGLRWEYEAEGFDLGHGYKYLPDFWLPELDCWIEIKPIMRDIEDWPVGEVKLKAELLAQKTGKHVFILVGTPGPVGGMGVLDKDSYTGFAVAPLIGLYDNSYWWCVCPICGSVGIQYDGRSGRNIHEPNCQYHDDKTDPKNYNFDDPRLHLAYNAARSARFEFGEQG